MNIADELGKLGELRAAGHLTEAEFITAKNRVLAGESKTTDDPREEPATEPTIPLEEEKIFRSSRWSSGNLFFPDALTLSSSGILFHKGALMGSSKEHINHQAVASVRVDNGLFLSTISIETSGGSQPIVINGLWKSDAREIQDLIRAFEDRD